MNKRPVKSLEPVEYAIVVEGMEKGHGKELIRRALKREGFDRSVESVRCHIDAIRRREREEVKP